jgi:hypothetical protein
MAISQPKMICFCKMSDVFQSREYAVCPQPGQEQDCSHETKAAGMNFLIVLLVLAVLVSELGQELG